VVRGAVAISIPPAVLWLMARSVSHCASVDYAAFLWGAPGVALVCSIGVMLLLLTGTRLFSRP
jgi:hypothetical protein